MNLVQIEPNSYLQIKIRFMNFFLKRTKFIWVTSRVLLIFLFLSALLSQINNHELSDLIVNGLLALYIGSLVLISIFGLQKRKIHFGIRLFVGIFTIFTGLTISFLVLIVSQVNYGVPAKIGFQIIPLWISLYGVYELLKAYEALRHSELRSK